MDRKIRIAINGFGRIGRAFFKLARKYPEFDIVAVNDLGDPENMVYLLKYDTAYGKADFDIHTEKEGETLFFVVDGERTKLVQEKEPTKLPWGELGVDVVVESTGRFTSFDKARAHLDAGAKRVVITAPVKGEAVPGISGVTALMGINDGQIEGAQITSNGSCTTNAAAPIIAILHEKLGIEKAILNTTHAMTGTQSVVDGPGGKDLRGGRAASMNMIPATTGAAIAVTEVIPELKGKFDGVAVRVPVITGSIADVTFISKRETSAEEVNQMLRDAANEPRWKEVFAVTEEPIVSSDIVGSEYGSIADLGMTRVVGGNLVKVLAWYDNEMGYTATLVKHVRVVGQKIG